MIFILAVRVLKISSVFLGNSARFTVSKKYLFIRTQYENTFFSIAVKISFPITKQIVTCISHAGSKPLFFRNPGTSSNVSTKI